MTAVGERAAAAGGGRPGDRRPRGGPWPSDVVAQDRGVLRASRGFYGVLRVVREEPGEPDEYVKLLHGQITHGLQLSAPLAAAELTAYYGPSSGAGLAIRRHPKRLAGRPMRVGVIGLGVGTLAAWSRPGDVFRFYELDPEVARLSEGTRPVFSYLRDAPGRGERQPGRRPPRARERGAAGLRRAGGGRLQQRRDTRRTSSRARRSASTSATWRRAGVLAVHVTNRYLDLKPVVRGAAAAARAARGARPVGRAGPPVVVRLDAGGPRRALLEDEVVSAATLPRLPRRGRRRLDGRLERPPRRPEALRPCRSD